MATLPKKIKFVIFFYFGYYSHGGREFSEKPEFDKMEEISKKKPVNIFLISALGFKKFWNQKKQSNFIVLIRGYLTK